MNKIISLLFFCTITISTLYADTLTVYPNGTGLWPTIQFAIDNSSDGDVILLEDGIFKGIGNRDISTLGKAITIKSECSIPENCVIDCEGVFNLYERRGFIINNGEDTTTKIKDISIINGSTMQACPGCKGAAVLIENSIPLFENVIFKNNHGSRSVFDVTGGSHLIIRNCTFCFNIADFNPCIDASGNSTLIEKCLFYQNSCDYGSIIAFSVKSKVIGCTITNNDLGHGGYSTIFRYVGTFSGGSWNGFETIIENTLVTNNDTPNVFYHPDSCFPMPIFNHCNHWNNNGNNWVGFISNQYGVEGNISEDPLFVDTLNFDYRIQYGSPCIDAGNPDSPTDPDSSIADIGYYYYAHYVSTPDYFSNEMKIFPNPSSGIIHFNENQNPNNIFNLYIFNNLGKLLDILNNIDTNIPLDLSNLPNGIYHCYFKNNSSSFSQKLIICK